MSALHKPSSSAAQTASWTAAAVDGPACLPEPGGRRSRPRWPTASLASPRPAISKRTQPDLYVGRLWGRSNGQDRVFESENLWGGLERRGGGGGEQGGKATRTYRLRNTLPDMLNTSRRIASKSRTSLRAIHVALNWHVARSTSLVVQTSIISF